MDNACTTGCFATIFSSVSFISPYRVTRKEEIIKFKDWHQQLTDLIKANSPSLSVLPPNIVGCSAGSSRGEEAGGPSVGRPLQSVLNTNQRMAHDIFENQGNPNSSSCSCWVQEKLGKQSL